MGPTASGKSGIAIKLAQKFNGEIISADSRQVYRGLNIGAGKIPRQLTTINSQLSTKNTYFSENIPHHLIDVAEPMEDYNISHFKKDAEKIIKEIIGREKTPIICGGTNFWIDSITKNTIIPEVAPDELLRSMLRSKTTEELFEELKKIDPERAKNIDAKNPVRLIRAIEICKALGTVPKLFLQIGIKTEREELNAKIQKRLDERFNEGMINEVENLHKNGVSWEWMERIGLEYRWISRFLQNKVELEEMKKLLYFDIIHFAKRQMTWLKRNKNIIWLEKYDDIEKEVASFLE
ncbi:MAG: tRNA dimethylallyltransferase [Candidatus Moranbacteria bacterium GW2011_GWE2_36_40]|nr:MAG: tRNA dimethylallyltransferase [Candidatus Moranbacteria bacterium GW2011_GWE2_36_40]